jgi:hypothetical protein
MEETKFKFPTEMVELPSKGLLYPEESPLREGKVEMKYMTAREEDILTNQSYIQKGTVLDKVLESLIITPGVNIKDFIVGDKNALFVAARVLGYGKDYKFQYNGSPITVDLSLLENKPFDESIVTPGLNNFPFTLPSTDVKLTYKILTGHDEYNIEREINGLKKINPESSVELSTRLKFIITSVDGDSTPKTIREFVDNQLLARDSRALREYIRGNQPDIDLKFISDSGEEVAIPIGLNFFWPDV